MNKNKDKILLFPHGLVPKKAGWDEEKFMYTAMAGSFAFYDDTAPNSVAQLQGIKVLDMSLSQYADNMFRLLDAVKGEFWESVGVNRQRFGDTYASDGKGVTEQAIFRSALVSEETFRKFDKMKEKEANALIDYAKVAWIGGKKGAYLTEDGIPQLLNIVGPQFAIAEFGIFAKNSGEEYTKLKEFKSLGLSMLQNSVNIGLLAEIMDSNNFTKVKKIAKMAEKVMTDMENRKMEATKEAEQMITEREINLENLRGETEMYRADKAYDAAVDSAAIRAEMSGDESEKWKEDVARKRLALDEKRHTDDVRLRDKQINKSTNKK